MEILEKKILSVDGIHMLYGKIYVPDGRIRGAVQIVHGMAEHIDRYDDLMTFLAENGFVAFAHNQLGHKLTSNDDELGFFGYSDGFRHLVNDVIAYGDAVCEDYPDIPRFIYGHSMGSFVVRLAILHAPEKLSGVILSGTGGPVAASAGGLLLCDLVTLLKGGRHISKLVYKLTFGHFNDRFEQDNSSNWISSDREQVMKYRDDKYCNFRFAVCSMHDIIKVNHLSNRPVWAKAVDKNLPIYLVSGSDDPVGDYGRGIQTIYDRLKKEGCNVQMKLYPAMRHETLNDLCRDEAKNDILTFILNKI